MQDVRRVSAFVIMVLKFDSGGQNKKGRIWFGCERNGRSILKKKLKNGEEFRGSKKCEYPFQFKGDLISIRGPEWRFAIMTGVHNHSAAEYLEGHSCIGRLSESETFAVIEMLKCHVCPKDIPTSLNLKDPKNALTMKTIYNTRHKYKVNEQGRRMQHGTLII